MANLAVNRTADTLAHSACGHPAHVQPTKPLPHIVIRAPTLKKRPHKLALWIGAFALTLAATGCQSVANTPQNPEVVAMAKAGKAYFEEKCKTVAGEKIYRTVADVEGVLLMKVRPARSETELQDPKWAGAAFAIEAYGDGYIKTFLGYEHAAGRPDGTPGQVTPDKRGYITPDKRPGGLPGYHYVDVIDSKDGQRYRVIGTYKEITHTRSHDFVKVKTLDYVLEKTLATAPAPHYGVTYEDHVIPAERAIGVASSTVKVVDLSTNEVLGEMIRYVYRPRGLRLTEWLTADKCPGHAWGSDAASRKFVDQVLKPKAE
jgi:hypothetical protein